MRTRELSFSTFLTRNKGTTLELEKRFGCYREEHINLHRENSVSDPSQIIKIIPQQAPQRQTTHAICILAQREVYREENLAVKTIEIINLSATLMQNNPG